jgi:hypothetical protein
MKHILIAMIVFALMAVPVVAQYNTQYKAHKNQEVYETPDTPLGNSGYHEVYEWGLVGRPGTGWFINPEQHAELYGDLSEHNQYRWESNPAAQICMPPYYPPEPELPARKVIFDEAVLFPWIDFNVYEREIHWDIFKPGIFMGKTFQVFMSANTPIQILFGCGTIRVPEGFDPDANEIIWKDYTEKECLTDKIRIKSILGKTPPNPGTPPDELAEYLWWYEADCRPNPHVISPDELARIPDYGDDAWRHAPDLNGQVWIYPDSDQLHAGCWLQFFEYLEVQRCDSEGKYTKEIVLTVAPDP